MTSNINPNNIDGAYPVAGQDNNSQGFRDNFTNTKTNFQYAADEITDLQNNVVLKGALSGTTLNNNMNGVILSNAQVQNMSATTVALGVQTGTVTINYAAGSYQTLTTGGNVSLAFSNFPAAGPVVDVAVQVNVANVAHTLTLPAAVSINTNIVGAIWPAGASPVIEFPATGYYTFSFVTSNGGSSITVNQNNQTLIPFNNTKEAVATGDAVSLGITTSIFSTAGTATLDAGVEGLIKVLTQTSTASMVVTVTNPGWSGSGTITLNTQGESCTLQYTDGAWYCIGNNGATFA